jgi:hypothetical protein
MKITFSFTVKKWGVDIDGECKGNFTPSTPDVFYLRNGDPGYPGDPAELEAEEITIEGTYKLTPTELQAFENEYYDDLLDQAATYAVDTYDGPSDDH